MSNGMRAFGVVVLAVALWLSGIASCGASTPAVRFSESLPSEALGLPQLGEAVGAVQTERLTDAKLSEEDQSSLGQAMSLARREIQRPTERQAQLEQNRNAHFFASNPGQKLGVRFLPGGACVESKYEGRDWQATFRLADRPATAEVAAKGITSSLKCALRNVLSASY